MTYTWFGAILGVCVGTMLALADNLDGNGATLVCVASFTGGFFAGRAVDLVADWWREL